MDKVRVLIVDDEVLARRRIIRMLGERSEFFEIHEAGNGLDALEKIPRIRPHLVFLDVQMPELSGIEVLHNLEDRDFPVIFQTAYDEFALQAFEASAADYLLKPFPSSRLHQAVDRALGQIHARNRLADLERRLALREGLERLVVQQGRIRRVIPVERVLGFVSRDHYTCVLTETGEAIAELSLSHLEERLDDRQFVRIHRNGIVNLAFVAAIHAGPHPEVELLGGQRMAVSRRQKNQLRKRLRDWSGLPPSPSPARKSPRKREHGNGQPAPPP